jgi:hypothetical protein
MENTERVIGKSASYSFPPHRVYPEFYGKIDQKSCVAEKTTA